MAVIHLYRDTPEKGYKNTEMDCQEEFLEKFKKRGWKVKEESEKTANDEKPASKRGKRIATAENEEDSVNIIGE